MAKKQMRPLCTMQKGSLQRANTKKSEHIKKWRGMSSPSEASRCPAVRKRTWGAPPE